MRKKESILIMVKNNVALDNYIRMLNQGHFDNEIPYSREVKEMMEKFMSNNWDVYFATLENIDFDNKSINKVFDIKNKQISNFNLEELNSKISFIMMRNLGSVELNFNLIRKSLEFFIENFEGKVLNNPKAMIKGMTKDYLVEFDKDILEEFGIKLIPTKIYSNKLTLEQIDEQYPKDKQKYLVKPTTGELSNSLTSLDKVDEQFLRWKETKVGGWVIQPIQEDIWKGEYQVSFLDGEPIYSQKKEYPKSQDAIPSQKQRVIKKYAPSQREIESLKRLIDYVKKLYEIDIDILRIDYMKDDNENIILLEFEMVNPGFFIGYMSEDDIDVKNINDQIFNYCNKLKD